MKATGESLTTLQMIGAIKAVVAGPRNEFIKDINNSLISVSSEWIRNQEV